MQLPIDASLPEIVRHTERNTITLLQAEPGAGKTTRVPPALLRAGYSQVYVLEPRRLAARMAAQRVALEMGQCLGETVGYQIRFEKVSSDNTAIWFLTEGVFTNRLLGGWKLPPRSIVVLDEFHERHLETDLAFALLRNLLPHRPDIRLLVMSATLAPGLVERIPAAPLVDVKGRTFPVEVHYSPASSVPLEQQAAVAVARALATTGGHVLVFLPGAAEIRCTATACRTLAEKSGARVLPLHGDLSPAEQDGAVAPSTTRKIICSTNVAESSVTIDGVTAVVDSGLARIATHSPWTGYSRLQISRISQASAIQRAGRAGRTGPGLAIRLYTQEDFARRPEATPPEIVRADCAEILLRLSAAGYRASELPWIDPPHEASLTAGSELLQMLRAFDATGEITSFGRRLASMPVHPRLSCLALKGTEFGCDSEACQLAAWLAENSARLERGKAASDLDAILTADLTFAGRRTLGQLRDSTRLLSQVKPQRHALEKAVLCSYPDHIAARRGDMLLLANGTSARLDPHSLVEAAFLVALEVDDRDATSMPLVRIAIAIEPDWLVDLFPERIDAVEELRWNRQAERVEQVNLLRYNRLTIDESVSAPSDAVSASKLLVAKALDVALSNFADEKPIHSLLTRLRFASEHGAGVAPGDQLLGRAWQHLATGLTSFAELREAARDGGLQHAIETQVDMRLIDELAPTHVRLPAGRRAPIEYIDNQPPSVASRLQDFFGMQKSPAVARGTVPLLVKLLAPNGRPVQITKDLPSFWKELYPQVRRELSRRYPRHSWPEIPG